LANESRRRPDRWAPIQGVGRPRHRGGTRALRQRRPLRAPRPRS